MLENFFLRSQRNQNYGFILVYTLILTIVLGIINHFIGGNSLFLVALVALGLAYPTIAYLKEETTKEFTHKISLKKLLQDYENELMIFWCIFIAMTLGFYAIFPLVENVEAQEAFLSGLSGNITQTAHSFTSIFNNNMIVGLLTFILTLVSFSGLLFVLSWNASILAYFIYKASSTSSLLTNLSVLPHGLLEVGGYVFFGMAGMVLSYQVDTKDVKKNFIEKQFRKEFLILILLAVVFIFLGALVETL